MKSNSFSVHDTDDEDILLGSSALLEMASRAVPQESKDNDDHKTSASSLFSVAPDGQEHSNHNDNVPPAPSLSPQDWNRYGGICKVKGCDDCVQALCDGMCVVHYRETNVDPSEKKGEMEECHTANDNDTMEDYDKSRTNSHCGVVATCNVKGCGQRGASSRDGMCKFHYAQAGGVAAPPKNPKCKVQGCDKFRASSCDGMCWRHFKAAGGDPPMTVPKKCKVQGCDKFSRRSFDDMCQRHYSMTGGVAPKYLKCNFKGCDKLRQGSYDGMCKRHYRQVGRAPPIQKKCQVDGCTKNSQGSAFNSMCRRHFRRSGGVLPARVNFSVKSNSRASGVSSKSRMAAKSSPVSGVSTKSTVAGKSSPVSGVSSKSTVVAKSSPGRKSTMAAKRGETTKHSYGTRLNK